MEFRVSWDLQELQDFPEKMDAMELMELKEITGLRDLLDLEDIQANLVTKETSEHQPSVELEQRETRVSQGKMDMTVNGDSQVCQEPKETRAWTVAPDKMDNPEVRGQRDKREPWELDTTDRKENQDCREGQEDPENNQCQ